MDDLILSVDLQVVGYKPELANFEKLDAIPIKGQDDSEIVGACYYFYGDDNWGRGYDGSDKVENRDEELFKSRYVFRKNLSRGDLEATITHQYILKSEIDSSSPNLRRVDYTESATLRKDINQWGDYRVRSSGFTSLDFTLYRDNYYRSLGYAEGDANFDLSNNSFYVGFGDWNEKKLLNPCFFK